MRTLTFTDDQVYHRDDIPDVDLFLDSWWDEDKETYNHYHKIHRGHGTFMIVNFRKENPATFHNVILRMSKTRRARENSLLRERTRRDVLIRKGYKGARNKN